MDLGSDPSTFLGRPNIRIQFLQLSFPKAPQFVHICSQIKESFDLPIQTIQPTPGTERRNPGIFRFKVGWWFFWTPPKWGYKWKKILGYLTLWQPGVIPRVNLWITILFTARDYHPFTVSNSLSNLQPSTCQDPSFQGQELNIACFKHMSHTKKKKRILSMKVLVVLIGILRMVDYNPHVTV